MKLSAVETEAFAFGDVQGSAYPFSSDKFSLSLIAVDGAKPLVKNTVSDFVFYIQNGSGAFVINGQEFMVGVGDAVYIPKNTPYTYTGKMQFLEFMTPAYQDGAEVELK